MSTPRTGCCGGGGIFNATRASVSAGKCVQAAHGHALAPPTLTSTTPQHRYRGLRIQAGKGLGEVAGRAAWRASFACPAAQAWPRPQGHARPGNHVRKPLPARSSSKRPRPPRRPLATHLHDAGQSSQRGRRTTTPKDINKGAPFRLVGGTLTGSLRRPAPPPPLLLAPAPPSRWPLGAARSGAACNVKVLGVRGRGGGQTQPGEGW